jgi:sulfur-oxidizing protein SoxZ
MAETAVTRLRVPATAKSGEVIEIKTLISHPMQSGFQKDANGKTLPREIINTFACTYNGKQVFKMDLNPAISANPYIAFNVRVDKSGTFAFVWTHDDGTVYKDQAQITVS